MYRGAIAVKDADTRMWKTFVQSPDCQSQVEQIAHGARFDDEDML